MKSKKNVEKPAIGHLNRQIPPEAHTPMYNFHKYWSRKTWNVVGKFIENYCPEGGIVFDPFGGSGVTAMEALKIGRKAIISDINPIASEITRLTIKPVNLKKLYEAYQRIEQSVKEKISELYITKCRQCGLESAFDCAIWENNQCIEIRYGKCPSCSDSRHSDTPLTALDHNKLKHIEDLKIKEWYPADPFYYSNGKPFKKKEKYESVDELFTKRNLYALAMLRDAIEQEKSRDMRDFLKIGFTSMLHLCSKMTPVRPTRPLSSAWTEHSYWFADKFMEQNVWNKFESAIIGKQGLIKAKKESDKYYKNIKFGKKFQDVVEGNADIFIYNGDCLELMKNMYKYYGDEGCADYIFTDPPYDSSVQYGELSYMWAAWLKLNDKYLENIESMEIIHNEKQNKDFTVYASLLRHCFTGMFDVLKPNQYLSLTFHSPTFKVRNATIRAGVSAGFEFEKIHHQELARPSAKSLLQPFGSAQGDFYLRFHKPDIGKHGIKPEFIDQMRFEIIVIDTTVRILAERGEPTPYTLIINAIDPELAKHGFFPELEPGVDTESVLKKRLGQEFELVEGKIGGSTGKLWWFVNPGMVRNLEKIPLSERVEQTVLRQLQSKGKVTFTDIWDAVSIAFPNSLTSDQSGIRKSLEDYAHPVSGGYWMIKSDFRPEVVEKDHTTMIALLAEIGKASEYEIYIGRVEQNHKVDTPLLRKKGLLKDFVNYKNLSQLKNAQNIETVANIDILWIKNDRIEYLFEVEATTAMTSALHRGSNVEKSVPKVMLFPKERLNQFERKMKSPMFKETFEQESWHHIVFNMFYAHWNRHKAAMDIEDMFDSYPAVSSSSSDENSENQLRLAW